VKHDLWDWISRAPTLVRSRATDTRWTPRPDHQVGLRVRLDRANGNPLFPIAYRRRRIDDTRRAGGDEPALSHAVGAFVRQTLTKTMLTNRTPSAQRFGSQALFALSDERMYDPPKHPRTIIFPGVDGVASEGGPRRSTPERDCST